MTPAVHCALVHHPVLARSGETITTAVTNLDIHDIARSARSYGLAGYWVVTPIEAQRVLVERVLSHWRTGAGARRIPERSEALSLVHIVPRFEDAVAGVRDAHGGRAPRVLGTAATPKTDAPETSWGAERAALADGSGDGAPRLLVFGTGHGLAAPVLAASHAILPPIQPRADYNHLSVRAAAAIVFDRLLSAD